MTSSSTMPPVESTGATPGPSQPRGKLTPLPESYVASQAPPPYIMSADSPLLASGALSLPGMDQSIPWRAPPGETDSPTYNWPDAPDTDVEDNEKVREPVYKITQALRAIPGHEKAGTKESKPANRPHMTIPHNDNQQFKSETSSITNEEAKNALFDMVSYQCCYGNKAARGIDVEDIEYTASALYTLETFVEIRTHRHAHIPYKGQTISGPQEGAPPALWDVANPSPSWKAGLHTVKVPYSSTIEMCFACNGRGFNKCYRCQGRGRTKCKYCKAKGMQGKKHCIYCKAKGRQRCFRCNGHTFISCSVCEAYKQLEFFIEVTSKFSVKKDEYLHHTEKKLPKKMIRDLEGITFFEEEKQMVAPLSNFPTNEINTKSEQLVNKHADIQTERFVLQRHKLIGIPLAEVNYRWKEHGGRYWLCGTHRFVYAPDYPQQCCCACRCAIL